MQRSRYYFNIWLFSLLLTEKFFHCEERKDYTPNSSIFFICPFLSFNVIFFLALPNFLDQLNPVDFLSYQHRISNQIFKNKNDFKKVTMFKCSISIQMADFGVNSRQLYVGLLLYLFLLESAWFVKILHCHWIIGIL